MFYNRALVNALTEEEAAVENTSPSVIIENCILQQLMPKNEDIQFLLHQAYTNEMSIKRMLADLFGKLATYGEEGKRVKKNAKLLPFLSDRLRSREPSFTNNAMFSGEYHDNYLKSNVDSVLQSEETNGETLVNLHTASFEVAMETKEDVYPVLFMILADAWDEVYTMPSTYKVLMEICKLAPEDAFERADLYELRYLLMEIEKEWQ